MRFWRHRLFHKSTSHAPLTFALRTWCLDLSTDFTSKSTREHKDDDIFHTLFFNAVANTWTKYVAWLMQFTAWKLIFKNLIDRFYQNLTADVMHIEIIDSLWLRNRYIVFQVPYIQNGHHSSIIKLLANRDHQLSPVKF